LTEFGRKMPHSEIDMFFPMPLAKSRRVRKSSSITEFLQVFFSSTTPATKKSTQNRLSAKSSMAPRLDKVPWRFERVLMAMNILPFHQKWRNHKDASD